MTTDITSLQLSEAHELELEAEGSLEEYAGASAGFYVVSSEGSANTRRAYAGDWKRFEAWCSKRRRVPLPAGVPTVVAFVTHLATTGKKLATIQRHAAAITKQHHLHDLPSPTDHRKFKTVLDGIAITLGRVQHQAPAFSLAYFKQCIIGIDVSHAAGLRDRTLLLLGLAGAFRREELSQVDLEHLRFDAEGLVVQLPRSKTNQKGDAEEKAIFFSPDRRTCPIRTLQDWVAVLRQDGHTSGPLFLSFFHKRLSRRRLTPVSINTIVRKHLKEPYTAHSLRASFVTIAKLNGLDDSKVMNQTKHKTTAMIRKYTRLDNVRQHNAAQELGL